MANWSPDISDVPKYGPPNMAAELFRMISSIPNAYREGQKGAYEQGQRERTERLQEPIEGPQDYASLVSKLLASQGTEAIPAVLPTAWKTEFAGQAGRPMPWDSPSGGAPNTTPTAQTGAALNNAAERQGQGDVAQDIDSQGRSRGPINIRQLAIRAGIDPNDKSLVGHFGPEMLDKNLTLGQARMVAAEIRNIKSAGMFGPAEDQPESTASFDDRFGAAQSPAGGASMQPQAGPGPGPTAQAGPQLGQGPAPGAPSAMAAPGAGLVPQGWLRGGGRATGFAPTELGYAQYLQAQAQRNGVLGFTESAKVQQAHAERILDSIKQAAEPTGPQKEARDPAVNAAKAQGKLGEDLAAAKAKRVGEVIEAGGLPNRQTVNVLNEMEDAMRHAGNNISTGPGAERWLKVKQAANNLWPDLFKGVPETEAVVKLNAQLASAAAKAMTARPSQLEFRAFMANNPGIANSPQGSYALINLLRQAKEQELALSREAMRLKPGNIDQWTDIEDRFYEKHPLISPFTGKPLTGDASTRAQQERPAQPLPPPQVGSVVGGHRYKGGALNDPRSWEVVGPRDRS